MVELVFAEEAVDDLDAIVDYVAVRNISAADRLFDRIYETCEMLAANPWLGRERDELLPSMRSFAVSEHVIFYAPMNEGILVLRILHGHRDIPSVF